MGAATCGVGAWLALSGGISYAFNLKAEMARTRMDGPEAEADYHKAIRWDTGNWQPHLGLGDLRSMQARWFRDPDPEAERAEKQRLAQEAKSHFRRAAELNASDMAVEFGLARVANATGDRETALENLRRAAMYQRRHKFYREQLGIQLRQMGRDQEALDVFRQNMEDGVASEVSVINIRALERKQAKAAAAVPPAQ